MGDGQERILGNGVRATVYITGTRVAGNNAAAAYRDAPDVAKPAAYAAAQAAWAANAASNPAFGDYVTHLIAAAEYAVAASDAASRALVDAEYADTIVDSTLARISASLAGIHTQVAIRSEFELLKAMAQQERWTDRTPVPPELFGPLWPGKEPEGWPKTEQTKNQQSCALRLQFSIPSSADRSEIDRQIGEIIRAANDLHLAYGGSGLTIADNIRVYEPALVPAGGDR